MRFLNNYKWYRKLRGGSWYYNRHIFDYGRGVKYIWERKDDLRYYMFYNVTTLKEEHYT